MKRSSVAVILLSALFIGGCASGEIYRSPAQKVGVVFTQSSRERETYLQAHPEIRQAMLKPSPDLEKKQKTSKQKAIAYQQMDPEPTPQPAQQQPAPQIIIEKIVVQQQPVQEKIVALSLQPVYQNVIYCRPWYGQMVGGFIPVQTGWRYPAGYYGNYPGSYSFFGGVSSHNHWFFGGAVNGNLNP